MLSISRLIRRGVELDRPRRNAPKRGPRTRARALWLLEVLEPRLAPAVFNVPADYATIGQAIADGVSKSQDPADTIVLGPSTIPFPVANQMIAPFVIPNSYKSLTIVGQGPGQTIITANQQGR